MALGHGPRVVTDGLVLALDAADPNSYDSRVRGQQTYTSSGEYSWTCPSGVTSVSVVCIGGGGGGNGGGNGVGGAGGGGGGGLGYKNNISVTPGQSYIVVVGGGGAGDAWDGPPFSANPADNGGDSYFINATTVKGGGGGGGYGNSSATGGSGGTYVGDGGGNGNSGGTGSGSASLPATGGGGGSTGTYTGNATTRGTSKYITSNCTSGCLAGSGTGQGLLGTGFSGTYGRGGGANMETFANGTSGNTGAVRIMWGPDRSYPSTGVADQSISTDFNDLSGKGNNGTLTGATFNSSNGGFLDFDGSNDYVSHSNDSFVSNGGSTLEFWFNADTFSDLRSLINHSGFNYFNLITDTNNKIRLEYKSTSASNTKLFSTSTISTGSWYHVVGVVNSTGARIYINGELDASNSTPQNLGTVSSTLYVGGYTNNSSYRFDGKIAVAKRYDKPLTASEVLQNYNAHRGRYGI